MQYALIFYDLQLILLSWREWGSGGSDSTFARFSDPFNLSGTPVLPTITLQPLQPPPTAIPEPSTFALVIVGALVLLSPVKRKS